MTKKQLIEMVRKVIKEERSFLKENSEIIEIQDVNDIEKPNVK